MNPWRWLPRTNRATYWVYLGLIVALYALFSLVSKKHTAMSEVVLIFACVPRLHDIGKSGWWAGGFFLAEIVIAILAVVLLPLKTATIVLGLFTLVVAGVLIWLGTVRGDPAANRFGEPPPPGVSWGGRRKPAPG